jgi:hypothetical protein
MLLCLGYRIPCLPFASFFCSCLPMILIIISRQFREELLSRRTQRTCMQLQLPIEHPSECPWTPSPWLSWDTDDDERNETPVTLQTNCTDKENGLRDHKRKKSWKGLRERHAAWSLPQPSACALGVSLSSRIEPHFAKSSHEWEARTATAETAYACHSLSINSQYQTTPARKWS